MIRAFAKLPTKDHNLLDWKTLWQEFGEKYTANINSIEQTELSTSSAQNAFSDLFIGLDIEENNSSGKMIDKEDCNFFDYKPLKNIKI